MALIPVHVGERTALIHKPDKPWCSTPGCRWPTVARCCYPVIRDGKATTCGAKLCVNHGLPAERPICPPHARMMKRG